MENITKYAAILCAGNSLRSNLGHNKTLFCLGGKTLLATVLEKFAGFDRILVVANHESVSLIKEIAIDFGAEVIIGGATRHESSKIAINYLFNSGDSEAIVAIHDGARPFVSRNLIDKTVQSAAEFGSGVAAVRVVDSLKRAHGFVVTEAVDREDLYAMQTPQAFKLGEIFTAYATVAGDFSDDGEVYRSAGHELSLVEGEYSNKKMTVEADFTNAAAQSIGIGYDVHRLVKKRKLILGGIEIPHKKGLLGHSDADVLLHAIADAVLSAAGQPDIGVLFPDTSKINEGISSAKILRAAHEKLSESSQKIAFISAVVMAQRPKIAPFIGKMRDKIAEILQISPEKVNISATTTESLGVIGRGRAIAAMASCICGFE